MEKDMTTTDRQHDEATIRELLGEWRDAVQRKDIEGVMANYAPDMVGFDAWGDLRIDVDTYRDHWMQAFAGHDGPIHIEHHDVHLVVGDGVAFCRCLVNMGGTLQDGTQHSFWGRGTICFEKRGGRWLVTHEHASAPFDPMTGRACTDLTP